MHAQPMANAGNNPCGDIFCHFTFSRHLLRANHGANSSAGEGITRPSLMRYGSFNLESELEKGALVSVTAASSLKHDYLNVVPKQLLPLCRIVIK